MCAIVDILKIRNDASDEFIRIVKQIDSKILSNYIISAYELKNVTLARK